jgi:hypothetical protein
MSITGDCYAGDYEGRKIELVRNNWNKTLKLLIDGEVVAQESRILPHDITLTAEFEQNGVRHAVVARSVAHFISTDDSVEIDGKPLTLTKG